MQTWKYRVFASHLDPADLVVLLDQSGDAGWELVTVVAVVDHLPAEFIDPNPAPDTDIQPPVVPDQATIAAEAELVPLQAFRYIFKRPVM